MLTTQDLEEKRNKLESLKSDFEIEFNSFLKYSQDDEETTDRDIIEEKFDTAKATLDEAVEIVGDLSEDNELFPDGISSLPSDLRWESDIDNILSQFDSAIEDTSIAIKIAEEQELYGIKINIDFSTEDENLTSENKAQLAQEIIPSMLETKNLLEKIIEETEHEGVSWISSASAQVLLRCNPESFSEQEIEDIHNEIPSDSVISELAEFCTKNNVELPPLGKDLGSISHDATCECEANNKRGFIQILEDIVKIYATTETALDNIAPEIDYDMSEDQINQYIQEVVQDSTQPQNGFAYKLKEEPDTDNLTEISKNAPDMSIMKKDDDYYIASNSSEFDKIQVAYTYFQIDGEVPQALKENLNLNTNTGLSDTAIDELKMSINPQTDAELTASLQAYNEANEPKPTTNLTQK